LTKPKPLIESALSQS